MCFTCTGMLDLGLAFWFVIFGVHEGKGGREEEGGGEGRGSASE